MRLARQWLVSMAALLLLPASSVFAQARPEPEDELKSQQVVVVSPLSFSLSPQVGIPLGPDASIFGTGGGLDVGLRYDFPRSPFFLLGGLEYSFLPTSVSRSVSVGAGTAGVGLQFAIARGVRVEGYGEGGYYLAALNDFSASAAEPYLRGGVGVRFFLNPSWSLGLEGAYTELFGLYGGLSVGLGTSISLGNLGGTVDIPAVHLLPAYPVFYKYYDDHPLGTLSLHNSLKIPVTGIRVQLYIKEYMDAPKVMEVSGALPPGGTRDIDLFALFTDKTLSITEGTKAAAQITLEYQANGETYYSRVVQSASLLGRNAMTWDDNRKAAAYVTAKDPAVLEFARGVTSFIRGQEKRAIIPNLQAAIALHEALDLYGINYVPNPVTPYTEASRDVHVVDFLQFPRETFQYRAGDCSDISILYSALLQAVGIDTAFVTIPGHIFVAVSTGLTPEQARNGLLPSDQLIASGGRVWIPVEITLRREGFMGAWALGAREWNENATAGQAGFYPVREAWTAYPAVGLPGAELHVAVPSPDRVLDRYRVQAQAFVDAALGPEIARMQKDIRATGSVSVTNALGVLYAKFGRFDEAEAAFRQVLAANEYLPSLLNLGNIELRRGSWKEALAFYTRANALDPRNSRVLLALVKASQALGNESEAQRWHAELKELDPTLAGPDEGSAAGDASGTRAAEVSRLEEENQWAAE